VSRAGPLLVTLVVLGFAFFASGCLSDNVEREGDFSMYIGVELIQPIETSGGRVWGIHALGIESDLPQKTFETMEIDGLGDYGTRAVDLRTAEVGMWKARAGIDYYDQSEHMNFFIAAVEDLNSTLSVVADHTYLDDEASLHTPTGLSVEPLDNMETVHQEEMGAILAHTGDLGNNWSLRVALPVGSEGNVTYLWYYHDASDEILSARTLGIVISPGEVHELTYVRPYSLHITITNVTGPSEPSFDDQYDALPPDRRRYLDRRLWEGHAKEITGGECSTSLLGPLVLVTVAIAYPGRPRANSNRL
jgi:hypothetical protein